MKKTIANTSIKLLVAIVIFVTLTIELIAQNNCKYSFKGTIINAETKKAFENIVVINDKTGEQKTSDQNGEFMFTNLCHQSYTFTINHTGYKTLIIKYHIHSDLNEIINLHSDTCHYESITVTAKKENKSSTQSTLELTEKELDLTRGQSLGEALKTLPGVNAIQTGPSVFKPVIEGLYGNRVLIMNNEVRLEGQNWGSDHAPEIDPFVASKISVVKGASTVKYGADALGGVVLIAPSTLRTEAGIDGQINLVGNTNNYQGVVSGILNYVPSKIKYLSTRIQGTIDRGGNYKTPDYYLKNTATFGYNGSWAINYTKSKWGTELFYSLFNNKLGIFEGAHLHSVSDVENVIANGKPFVTSGFSYNINKPYQLIQHELFKVKSYYNINSKWNANLILARQFNYRAEFDVDQPLRNIILGINVPTIEFNLTTYNANIDIIHQKIKNFKGEFGVNAQLQTNNVSSTNIRLFIPDYESNTIGLYGIEKWKKHLIEVELGARIEQKNYEVTRTKKPLKNLSYTNFSWSSGVNYFINDHWNSSLNFGQSKRSPAINELFSDGLHHGDGVFVFGDTSLKSETCTNLHWVSNYYYKNTFGEINIYQNNINNYIYFKPSGSLLTTVRGTYPVFNYSQTNAIFRGIDASFNQSIYSHITIGAKGSYLWAYNTSQDDYLVFIPANKLEINLKYQFKDFGNIKQPYIAMQWQYVAKQNNTPQKTIVDAKNQGVIFNNLANTGDYLPPPPAYQLIGISTGLDLSINKNILSINLVVNNLLNTKYRDYLNRFRYYADEVGRNISLKIKYSF